MNEEFSSVMTALSQFSELAQDLTVVMVLLWRLVRADRIIDGYREQQTERLSRVETLADANRSAIQKTTKADE